MNSFQWKQRLFKWINNFFKNTPKSKSYKSQEQITNPFMKVQNESFFQWSFSFNKNTFKSNLLTNAQMYKLQIHAWS
jgi:hypothetical protein